MKYLGLFLMLIFPGALQAQRLTGLLLSEENRTPLAHATITAGGNMAQSNSSGIFTIDIPVNRDSIRITCAGYTKYAFKPKVDVKKDTLVIYLQLMVYNLQEVKVKASRNFKLDSIRTRNEFAGVFNYKGTSFSDMFAKVDINKKAHEDYITSRNNTTQLVSVDVLQVIGLLSKSKDRTSKLKQVLIKEESENRVDQRFSTGKVKDITGLGGDSLVIFMQRYRPTLSQLNQLNDYDLTAYIKKLYTQYIGSTKP